MANTVVDSPTLQSTQFHSLAQIEKYLEENPTLFPKTEDVEHLIDQEFPEERSVPTMKDADDSICICVEHENGLPYQVGQWVERLGDDMCWHFEPIRRVIHYDTGEYLYKTEAGLLVKTREVRCSEEGVKRQFGMRPHLWQQWALLRLEQHLRFQLHHQRDFLSINYQMEANVLWNEWMNHPRNEDFKRLYESKPLPMQEKLKTHMFSPFLMMDLAVFEWPLDELEPSIFQYNSFLGSGWITSIVVLFIQLSVPFLLLIFSVRTSPRFPQFTYTDNASTVDFALIFDTDWDTFCVNYTPLDKIIMEYIIIVVYGIRVVPLVYATFYDTVGDSPKLISKLNSIRIITFLQGDDKIPMKCGYKLFTYMKSAYIAMINLLLLFVLFLTMSTIDVILNALALEFVMNFDVEIASRYWYDQEKRFFKAGVLEIIFCGGLLLEHFDTEETFCETYQVDPIAYKERINGPLNDLKQAEIDLLNPLYMDLDERIWRSMGHVARKHRIKEAILQFDELPTAFGAIDLFILRFLPVDWVRGIFNRYLEYNTWSKFDHALFLPPLQYDTTTSTVSDDQPVLNYHPDSMVHPMLRFARWCLKALLFGNVIFTLKTNWRRGEYFQLPFMFVDAVFEWFTFVFILFLFPLALCLSVFLVIYCQPLLTSTLQNDIFNDNYAFGG